MNLKEADINVVTHLPVHFALLMWEKVSHGRTYSILGMLHMVFEDKYTMSCKEIPVAILLLSVFTNGLEYLSLKSISVYFEPKTSLFVARCWVCEPDPPHKLDSFSFFIPCSLWAHFACHHSLNWKEFVMSLFFQTN